ncbi:MAG: EAL domain-containing protein [Betaproteobacteria bacterium]|nr:EAL domain-containing protein [Betaproteobacteria bacterium]MDE2623077.1 EAL domain-containing protein [Betaproteobacteria bacterium]
MGVWDWHLDTDLVYRSDQWHEIFGYSTGEVGATAQDGRTLIHPDDLEQAIQDIKDHLAGKTPIFTSEFRMRCKDGSWKWTLSRGMIVSTDTRGRPLRLIGTHTDISEQKRSEAEMLRLAHYDPITDLPNRILFLDRFEQEIRKAQRHRRSLALMFIDLDRFKEINDTLGHDTGDRLLQESGLRLLECVRATDTVARLGGDEFTILLTNLEDMGHVDRVAQTIIDTIAQPFQFGDEMVYITASIGITLYPHDATGMEILVKNADQAMYAAKNNGRNGYHYFTPSMQAAAFLRMRTANDLRKAVQLGQIQVHYQPIVELATGRVSKAEALVRWAHPERGLVYPGEFIAVAEDTGLITTIGDEVFAQAARQTALWRQAFPGFQMTVNKSPAQFRNNEREQSHWLELLDALGLPGESIVVEITEGLLLDAHAQTIRKLESFHDVGMRIAIDDFGTGYSSLAYLKKFEIDYLKIDQSFTANLHPESDNLAICEAVVVMAHKLGIQVIAEGVETEAQRDLLLKAGCDYAQGFLFSHPLPASEFEGRFFPTR